MRSVTRPWTLIDQFGGASVEGIAKFDLIVSDAGANRPPQRRSLQWRDAEVVTDQGLGHEPKSGRLCPRLCAKLVEEIGEGKHKGQSRSV